MPQPDAATRSPTGSPITYVRGFLWGLGRGANLWGFVGPLTATDQHVARGMTVDATSHLDLWITAHGEARSDSRRYHTLDKRGHTHGNLSRSEIGSAWWPAGIPSLRGPIISS